MVEAFSRVVVPGSTAEPQVYGGPLWLTIEFDGRRLSICGVEGPRRGGDAFGTAGQCVEALGRLKVLGTDWTADRVETLAAVWRGWHLNDMRAGCDHQRATWPDGGKLVKVATWKLSSESLLASHAISRRVDDAIKAEGRAEVSEVERTVLAAPLRIKGPAEADTPAGYVVESVESRPICSTYPAEHPEGLLMRPCEVCGYRYGSAWQFESVPDGVLEWLRNLPAAPAAHPWGDVDSLKPAGAGGKG